MRRIITSVFIVLLGSITLLYAQGTRASIFSLVKTTDTTASSVQVGCAAASSTCTGGIRAGQISLVSGMAVSGGTNSTAGIVFGSLVPGSTSMALYNNAGTLMWNGTPLATGSSVSGTANRIAFFSSSVTVGDSIIAQDGGATTATITGTTNTTVAYQLNGVSLNTTGTLTNVAYKGQNNSFTTVQSFAAGIGISGGAPSTHGIMIPTAVPASNTTNLHNDGVGLTWAGVFQTYLVDTGQGQNELYDMDQNVLTTSPVVFTTLNTGQGANELYGMDQNVLTTSAVTHTMVTATTGVTLSGSAANVYLGSNFLSGDGGDEGVSVAADGVVSFSGAFKERGRTAAVGEWTDEVYAAGDYTASAGSWTVDAGDVTTNRYTQVGKTVIWQIVIVNTDVSAAPEYLRVAIPGVLTEAAYTHYGACGLATNAGAAAEPGRWIVSSTVVGYVSLGRALVGDVWSGTSADNTSIACTIIFEIA